MKSRILSKTLRVLTLVAVLCMVPQQADAQLFGLVQGGAKALKNAGAKSKYQPLADKAEAAVQNWDIPYLISNECMFELPAQGEKLSGNAAAQWADLQKRIFGVLYVELHTIDQAGFCESIGTLMGKAKAAETVQMKALYVDAAIGLMKAMIVYNYDVNANRAAVDEAYNSIKAEWDLLPDSYKPVTVPQNANIRDPRYLHNLKGGIPDADFIIAYQEKLKNQEAEEAAKKQAAAAAAAESKKKEFAKGNSSCQFFVWTQKSGSTNLERVDIANIASGTSSFNINEKGGTSSIGKFVLEGDVYVVYKGSSVVGYISDEWKFYNYNKEYIGELTTGGYAYDKNGYTLGEVSSSTVKFGSSYKWHCSGSIYTKLFPAAVFIFFNNQFANYINIQSAQ